MKDFEDPVWASLSLSLPLSSTLNSYFQLLILSQIMLKALLMAKLCKSLKSI